MPLPAPIAASRAKLEMTRALRPITILLAAAALFAAVPAAHAAPAALQTPTNNCWRDVVNDWLHNQPNVVGSYPIPCYTQAIQHLNALPDIKGYSSAPDDIQRALLAAIHQERGGGLSGGLGVHDATSIPLPLIVLGALAVLLALAALFTWLARRIQTRRIQPAPAVSRRR